MPASAADVNYAWDDAETEDNNRETRGCIFVASQGGGCFQVPLVPGGLPGKRVTVTPSNESTVKVDDARFCIGECGNAVLEHSSFLHHILSSLIWMNPSCFASTFRS